MPDPEENDEQRKKKKEIEEEIREKKNKAFQERIDAENASFLKNRKV